MPYPASTGRLAADRGDTVTRKTIGMTTPDHDAESLFLDYLERQKRGEAVDWEELCAQHPQLADQLREQKRLWDSYGSLVSDAPSVGALAPGRVIAGKYELQRKLGGGGFGQVWLAKQLPSGQKVALKLAHVDEFDLDRAAELRRRLSNEAVAMGRSRHPGIVTLLDSGVDGAMAWMAMEYVDGGDLKLGLAEARALHERGELPDDYDKGVATLLAKVCDAMQAAHNRLVIHRDLKPDNIMVADAEPKVTDFGLARLEDLSLSRTGSLAGTYYYMSPEQVRMVVSNDLDTRTDIFSLGVVLYEMLALAKPFHGDTAVQITEQILEREPPDPRFLRPKAAPELCVIASKAMEKDRERRYQTMADFAADLRRYLADEPILARPPTRMELLRKWIRRHPVAASVIGVASVASLTISVLAWNIELQRREKEEQRKTAVEQRDLAERRRLGLVGLAVKRLDSLDSVAELPGASTPANIPRLQDWLDLASRFSIHSTDATDVNQIEADIKRLREKAIGTVPASTEVDTPLDSARLWLGYAQNQLAWLRAMWGRTPAADPSAEVERMQVEQRLPQDLDDVEALLDACSYVVPHELGAGARTIFLSDRADVVGLHLASAESLRNLVVQPIELQRSAEHRCRLTRVVWWLACARGLLDEVTDARLASDLEDMRTMELCYPHRLEVWEQEAMDVREMRELIRRLRTNPEAVLNWAKQDVDLLTRAESVLSQKWLLADRQLQQLHDELVESWWKVAKFHVGFRGGPGAEGWDSQGRPAVRQRLALAQEAQAVDLSQETERAWQRTLAAVGESPRYSAAKWPSPQGLQRQSSLFPLGPDPESGLEEFAVLGTGEVPVRGASGAIVPAAGHAIVMVLLPGGESRQVFERGNGFTVDVTDRKERSDLTFDRRRVGPPFFLAKYELTRAQWKRLANSQQLDKQPETWTGNHLLPASRMDWFQARAVLEQAGMSLPTIAEWDLAAFSSPSDVYVCGQDAECLRSYGNISDVSRVQLENISSSKAGEAWDDGHPRLAKVGSYRPTTNGLFDMAGNVGEWCLDCLSSTRDGHDLLSIWDDGLGGTHARTDGDLRFVKGGSWANLADQCMQGRSLAPFANELQDTNGIRPFIRLGLSK